MVAGSSGLQQRTAPATDARLAAAHGWDWQVELVFNPDKVLAEATAVIATSDSAILDRCQRWVNLTRRVITESIRGRGSWILAWLNRRRRRERGRLNERLTGFALNHVVVQGTLPSPITAHVPQSSGKPQRPQGPGARGAGE